MALTRASGKLYRMQVEETNRPNLAGWYDLGDVATIPVANPTFFDQLKQKLKERPIPGVPWWGIGLGGALAYFAWKKLR